MASKQKPLVSIFAGSNSSALGEKIAKSFGTKIGKSEVVVFSDGEMQPSFEENVRGRDVFIVQSTNAPSENLMEMLMMIDAARRSSARKVTAVIPYFGYGRQDRKDKPRVSIAAKLTANLLTAARIDRLITLDLHADQIQGFFDVPVDHMYASNIFVPYMKSLELDNLIMASPDTGGTRRAASYAKALHTGFVICYKHRAKPNVVEDIRLIGDVKGKDVVLVDDIIDTAGTITKAAKVIMDEGANTVRAFCTHPVLSGPAYERLQESPFTEVVVTDTLSIKEGCDKITVLTSADLIAEVIHRVQNYKSISSLFNLSKKK
jgi:ribose-phosphate pyrophosphokinase